MKIFFAGSIRGGRQLIPTYQYIIGFLKSHDQVVMSEHVASKDLEKTEAKMSEKDIFEKDINWIKEADCVIAEITVPSIGVGYEICHAVTLGKPVLCLYEKGAKASAMVLGNENVTAKQYSCKEELEPILLDFIQS